MHNSSWTDGNTDKMGIKVPGIYTKLSKGIYLEG
jgi:hypothetical protein